MQWTQALTTCLVGFLVSGYLQKRLRVGLLHSITLGMSYTKNHRILQPLDLEPLERCRPNASGLRSSSYCTSIFIYPRPTYRASSNRLSLVVGATRSHEPAVINGLLVCWDTLSYVIRSLTCHAKDSTSIRVKFVIGTRSLVLS